MDYDEEYAANNCLNRRDCRIHSTLRGRNHHGQYHFLFSQLKGDEQRFKRYTRMPVATFDKLFAMLRESLTKRSRREPISPEERLIVCLRFLATGESFRSIGHSFLLGETTVGKICRETCAAIVAEMKERYLRVPSTEAEWKEISDGFWSTWQMPNCLGAVDGKHVKIKAPVNSGSLCWSRFLAGGLPVAE